MAKTRNGHGATTVLKRRAVKRNSNVKARNGYQDRRSGYKGSEQGTLSKKGSNPESSPLPGGRGHRSSRGQANLKVSQLRLSTNPATASSKTQKPVALVPNHASSESEDDEEQTPLPRTMRSSNPGTPKYGMKQDGPGMKITPAKKSKVDPESKDGRGKKYEVEKILEVKIKETGEREFLLKWKGYPVNQATWEPEKGLACDNLLKAFMSKVVKKLN